MANRPVPNDQITTTARVRVGKNETAVDLVPFAAEVRLTVASGDAAVKHELFDLPAYARVDNIAFHLYGASTIATGTSVGIGGTSDPDEFLEVAENDIDAVGEDKIYNATAVDPAMSAKTLYLHSTNGSGTGAGTIYGDWGVRVTGVIVNPISAN